MQLPAIDNKLFAAAAPVKSNGKPLSSAPTAGKGSSLANVLSGPSVKNNSDLKSKNEFQSSLEDADTLNLSDSDTTEAAEAAPVASSEIKSVQTPMMMKAPTVKAAQSADQAQPMEHRLAWNSFLHKMKEKLGVSAQDIMSAFKSLTQEELQQPPEQNIAKLVQQLGLNDQQAAMAHQFFKELIVRTDAQPLNKEASLGLSAGPLAATSQQEIRQAKTEQSLKNMNDRFFMKPKVETSPVAPQTEKPFEMVSNDQKPSETQGIVIPPELMKESQTQEIPDIENLVPQQMKPVQGQEQKTPVKMTKAAMLEDVEMKEVPQAPTQAAASALPMPKFTPKNLTVPKPNLENSESIPTVAQNSTAPIPVMPLAPKFEGAPEKNFEESSDDSNVMTDGDEAMVAGQSFRIDTKDVQGNKELGKAMPTMAVPEFVQQAHVMVKDGGGEMKVVLTPEGLGEVAMKVSVKDGKVNVEMVTQTDEAKKQLQDSFHALREGLSQHHLNLETIKIDSAPSLSTQLDQQYRDAQRHQAQQFLEQFHQDNRGMRQSYFNIPGAETYRSQKDRTNVGPDMLSKPSATSRRLNLVA